MQYMYYLNRRGRQPDKKNIGTPGDDMATTTARNVANYFLSRVEEEVGDSISNLKLQKLVYYAQGYHLAIFGQPLFTEEIHAWTHGPVVLSLYHEYKEFGSSPIPSPDDFDPAVFSDERLNFLNDVYEAVGQYSAWKLRNMTHAEEPWREAHPRGGVISQESMSRYFKKQL